MKKFPIVVQGDESLQYVFPSKQQSVQQAIDLARADERIKRLIVFGSAVTMRCGIGSDLDLALDVPGADTEEFLKIAHPFFVGIDSEVDIIHYNEIHSELLKKEIDEKGVVVFDRS